MTDKEIFNELFTLAESSNDPEGVVAACLVKNGKILVSSASSDDGMYHAEYLVIEKANQKNIIIDDQCILYTTLEPCSDLPNVNDGRDCTSVIIEAGIKCIVFAASDPEYSQKAEKRIKNAGIKYKRVNNSEIIEKSKDIFNTTIKKKLKDFRLPRKKEL